jgi:hypothetical protein
MKAYQKFLATLALILPAYAANAVILAEDATEALTGTTVADEPHLHGVVIEDEQVFFSYASINGTVNGHVQLRVVRSDIDATLDFYWRVFNDEKSDDSIGSFRIGEFYTDQYNANFRIDGLGEDAPDTARRFSGTQSSYVNFNFARGLKAGDTSNFFFLDTDATHYARTGLFDIAGIGFGNISETFTMFAPAVRVSEPAGMFLLAAGLMGLGIRRRSR